jgi:amidase
LAALDDAVALLAELGHDVTEVGFCGITPAVGDAINTLIASATSWILSYWIRHTGREPGADDLEPGTRALWEAGKHITASEYLLAIEDLQEFSRGVAAFLTDFDLWLTPTLSAPPLPIGEMIATDDDPWRGLARGGETVRYAGVIANITGSPAISVPLSWNADGIPIGVHLLASFGDEATLFRLAAQLEEAQPWVDRWPPTNAVAR